MRREAEQTNPQCSKCGSRGEFGYKIQGQLQWFCAEHRVSLNYADARLPAPDPLAQHAAAIRSLGKRTIENIIEIGRHLTEAKELCFSRGDNWLPWLEQEFSWTEQTALNYMRLHERQADLKRVLDLDLPMRSLYLLVAPNTPQEAIESVAEQASKGERVSHTQAKQAVSEAKLKEQPEAKQQATKSSKTRRVIRQDLIDEAMTIIKSMDHDTWERFDKVYAKARGDLNVVYF